MENEAQYYKDLLLTLYPCKVPFSLAVKTDKPKKRLGTYYSGKKRVIIHSGWSSKYDMVETAIHEFAHHIHYTEFDKAKKKQAPHGKEFWQIYGQLMNRAKALGICNDKRATVIDFPGVVIPATFLVEYVGATVKEPPEVSAEINSVTTPDIQKAMKDLLRCVVHWFSGLSFTLKNAIVRK